MDLTLSPRAQDTLSQVDAFMTELVYPNESVYHRQRAELGYDNHDVPPVVEKLKAEAKQRGLWNLWLPDVSGFTNVEYGHMCELMGRSHRLAPVVFNCAAPDTGNMELLHMFGTDEQKKNWLEPLLAGEIRSAFAMTERNVASSDAANIETSIRRDGDNYVINGHKWFISGAASPACELLIVMGKTDHDADEHRQQSMILVPIDTPGVDVVRPLPVFGYQDQHGHCEIILRDVQVPATSLLGPEGGGFMLSQARLGPGRIHHCMRQIGAAERALELACTRALSRIAWGRPIADQGTVRAEIARSRIEIDANRLLVLHAAHLIDTVGAKNARHQISAIKVAVSNMACQVIDRAIQIHGSTGVSDETPLADFYASARSLRIADGPDDVHLAVVARYELAKHGEQPEA
ncbi:acyl-CoA dehydrogenase family protein [Saccharopolyspora shandongensis]|uniref:acyl-CoA dehydrogenase family protein n=1 Tax=Saccharopolyspora shandongensis TaxID=418495 RepID=UPI0033E8A4C7